MADIDELEFVEKLARAARGRIPPSVEVADGVMHRLKAEASPEPNGGFWPLAAGVSFAGAASILLAVQSVVALQEPLAELLSAVRAVFL